MKKKTSVRIIAIGVAVLLALSLLLMPIAAYAEELPEEDGVTVLFTHDLHDHLLPVALTTTDGETISSGGYARLKTAMDEARAKNEATFTFDAGDFSMGSLFQSIYMTDAPELRMLGALGVDAATLGNHEFDYGPGGVAAMLEAARNSGDPLPALVQANYTRPAPDAPAVGADETGIADALRNIGVSDYTVIERGGVSIAAFGLMGVDGDMCAPNSQMTLDDPIETAKSVVADIQANENVDMIVCLSHGGTDEDEKKSEDVLLAKAVPEIDLIVSGHTHTTLDQPIIEGSTIIVSSGSNSEFLGEVTLLPADGRWAVGSYELRPIDASIPDDAATVEKIEAFKAIAEEKYLEPYGLSFDQVLARNDILFTPQADLEYTDEEQPLGNLMADSYVYAISLAEGADYEPIALSAVPRGVVRASLPLGELTTANAFDALSLGIGPDGTIGYPLVSVYLTGRELSDAAEIDASVSKLMSVAKLYTAGVTYTYNPNRIPLDFVTDLKLRNPDGTEVWPDEDKLYRVVTDLYSAQMFASVKEAAFGLLKLVPKDAQGNEITDFSTAILHDKNGNEIKAWQCLATYLASFEPDADGVSVVPARYAEPDGRKILNDDDSLFAIISDPGATTLIAIGVAVVLIVLVILIAQIFIRRWSKRIDYNELQDHL